MNLRFEELPAYITEQIRDTLASEQRAADRRSLWAVVLRIVPKLDGNQWCCLYGENLQEGIAGFGPCPESSMCAFEEEFTKSTKQ